MDRKTYYNYTNDELANAYVDLLAYATPEANELRERAKCEIVDRFIAHYADNDNNNEDCEDFHLTDR